MAFTPAFTIATSIDPSAIILQDTSTGGSSGAKTRTILLYQTDSTLLVSAINWPIIAGTGDVITINPLQQDIALNIVVRYTDAGGNILYSSNQIYAFLQYTLLFLYQLTEAQSSNPAITQDTNYYDNKFKLFTEVLSAQNAITTGVDQAGAQQCIERAFLLTSNQNLFF